MKEEIAPTGAILRELDSVLDQLLILLHMVYPTLMPLSGLKLQESLMVLVTKVLKDTINIVTHQIVTCHLQKLVNFQLQSMICSLKTPTHHSSKTNYIKRSNSIHQKSSQLMLPLLHLGFKLKNILISGLVKNIKLHKPKKIHSRFKLKK